MKIPSLWQRFKKANANKKRSRAETIALNAFIAVGTIFCSFFIILAAISYALTGNPTGLGKMLNMFYIVESRYPGEVDKQTLLHGAMSGILASLGDKHSMYFYGDSLESFKAQMTATYCGVGMYLGPSEEGALVVDTIEDSPAREAAVQRGDVITAVDGKSIAGMKLDDITHLVRGDEGVPVVLTLRENGELRDVTLTRRPIHIKTVKGELIEGTDIGYIRLSMFNEGTGEEFTEAYQSLRSQGMNKMILDLRNNPGGIVDVATKVANNFVPPGSVVISFTTTDGEEKTYTVAGTESRPEIVVLINENSASAAEVVAGAIQDLKIGTIVGVRSYGKGTVQNVYQVSDDAMMKITVAKYRTSAGRDIDGIGIEPDITVQLRQGDPIDYQLLKAMELLKGE